MESSAGSKPSDGVFAPANEDPAEHEHVHRLKNKRKTGMLSMAIKEKIIKAGSG